MFLDSSCQVKHMTLVEIGHEQYIGQLAADIKRRQQEAESKPKIEIARRPLEIIRA